MFHRFSKCDGALVSLNTLLVGDATIEHHTNTSLVTKASEKFERTIQKRTKLQGYVIPEARKNTK